MALTGPYAIDYFVEQLPSLIESRRDLQARRRRSDRELFPLFRRAIEPAYGMPTYLAAHEVLLHAFDLEAHLNARHRILVVTGEPVLERMAGPGRSVPGRSPRHWHPSTRSGWSRPPARSGQAGISRSSTRPAPACASRPAGPT